MTTTAIISSIALAILTAIAIPTSAMSQERKRNTAELKTIQRVRKEFCEDLGMGASDIRISEQTIEFSAPGRPWLIPTDTFKLDLKNLGSVTVDEHRKPHYYFLLFGGQDPIGPRGRGSHPGEQDFSLPAAVLLLGHRKWFPDDDPEALAKAQGFADVLNRLSAYARGQRMPQDDLWHDFPEKAAAWRALPTKPPLSPEADRHRILAENAIKEQDLPSAIEHYESALEAQPMWPEGWFNLALICGELNRFADAADAMKHYLELAPDAPDAKDAREQIVIWQEKAKH